MNRKSEEIKEKQISEVMLSIENRVRHAYNQGYEQGLKASKQETCEQIKWERDTAIKQLNELGYGLGEKIKPCEDCISRQAVLDGLGSIAKVKAKSDAQKSLMGRVMFFVEQLSSVTPQPCEDVIKVAERSLCDSCTNIGCEFQSGIVRTKCAFYMPPHIESDNCGNYVVMQQTAEAPKMGR